MRVLHVGCGGAALPEWLSGHAETRLDVDASHRPDVVASMLDMGEIGPFDVVFCQHALEHVQRHQGQVALAEFYRVLKTGGHAVVFVPDLEGVAPTDEVVLTAPIGRITGHDLFYGYGPALEKYPHMAHRCGFVAATLEQAMCAAGFVDVKVLRLGDFNMMGAARK